VNYSLILLVICQFFKVFISESFMHCAGCPGGVLTALFGVQSTTAADA